LWRIRQLCLKSAARIDRVVDLKRLAYAGRFFSVALLQAARLSPAEDITKMALRPMD
jgi:hypothetical protein